MLSHRAFDSERQGRFHRHSVKMRRFSQPEVPSIVRGHSHACVNRCRSRVRSRDGFRYDPALGAPSLTAPRTTLSLRPRLRCARPPSPRIAPFRDFHAKRRHALLWVRLPPNDFCNYIPDVRTHPRAPDSRRSEEPPYAVFPNASSLSPLFFTELRPSPLEEGPRGLRAATDPSDIDPTAVQACRESRPRKPSTNHDAACGRRPDPITTCGDERWTMALDCTGRLASSEGLSLPPPAAAVRRGRKFPSSREPSELPFLACRRFFVRRAGLSLRPHESTEALVPTPPREGQRFPESRGAFHY